MGLTLLQFSGEIQVLGKYVQKFKPPSSNAQAALSFMPCDSSHTYAAMCCLALIAGTHQPAIKSIMVTASAGINAGNSDVSAPTMWRGQSGPARKGEAVRAHSDDAT